MTGFRVQPLDSIRFLGHHATRPGIDIQLTEPRWFKRVREIMAQLTGAEIFVEALKREGVKTIFALPGGVVLKIFDVLHQQQDVEVILTRLDYLRSWYDERHYSLSRCLYGFCSDGVFFWSSSDGADRQ